MRTTAKIKLMLQTDNIVISETGGEYAIILVNKNDGRESKEIGASLYTTIEKIFKTWRLQYGRR